MSLFRKNIEWTTDDAKDVIVYKYPFKNNGREVNGGSSLTVRDGQVAVFVHKGQIADVFGPGLHKLDTEIMPILTALASWKYKFETPITLDVYFVNTCQFTNIKWGTQNPIIMRDPEFGVVRVRGFGAFAFRVADAGKFLKQLFGTSSTFRTEDICGWIKTMLVSALSDVLGESKISALDLAANTLEFNETVKTTIQNKFAELGLELTNLFIENMSVPGEVEKALDERSKISILGDSTDKMMKIAAAEAMKSAAANPGAAGTFMGAGVGLGAGVGVGAAMGEAFKGGSDKTETHSSGKTCPSCGKSVPEKAKFCPECGAKIPSAKFCPECGKPVAAGAKFCPECGKKLD